jgi:hypothetical protein
VLLQDTSLCVLLQDTFNKIQRREEFYSGGGSAEDLLVDVDSPGAEG